MSTFIDLARQEGRSRQVVEQFVTQHGIKADIEQALAEGISVTALYRTVKKHYGAGFAHPTFYLYCANLRGKDGDDDA